jgi:Matrixin
MVSGKELVALLAAGLMAVIAYMVLDPGAFSLPGDSGLASGAGGNNPSPRGPDSDVPLGMPGALPFVVGQYAFGTMQEDGAAPVAYDPCRFIPVVLNLRTAPAAAQIVVAQALSEISQATGLQFTHEGLTDEAPSADREPFQPERYGDRWAPVLIAWSDEAEMPLLAGDIAGTGGSTWIPAADPSDTRVYVTGQVVIDGPQVAEMLAGPDGMATARSVVMHELGHLVGLDHVDSPGELMNARSDGSTVRFGPGDLHGLAAVGSGACVAKV